jgi:hypothetical protein
MTVNAFVGRPKSPGEADLAEALGTAKASWDRLVVDMAGELRLDGREWKSYGLKHGWSLRLQRGKRNIVHLAPHEGCFTVLLILGDRAMKAARASGLSASALKILDDAPRYPEGTGIRLRMKGPRQVPLVRKLARVKLEN